MTALKLLAIVAVSMLCGCGSAEQQVAKPREPDANSVGFFCRMGLTEHVGPKAQILPKGWTDPLWFSSVRDALTYAQTEVVSDREMAGFWVNDMEQGTWEKPAPGAWVAAQEAWYVIESRMASGYPCASSNKRLRWVTALLSTALISPRTAALPASGFLAV